MYTNLTAIYVADFVGVALLAVVLLCNTWRFRVRNKENMTLLGMLILTLVSCVVDPVLFTIDGVRGMPIKFLVYCGDSWLYASNLICAYLWFAFLTRHVGRGVSDIHQKVLYGVLVAGIVGIVVNLFCPFIFTIDADNVYHRKWGFWLYTAADYLITVDSIVVYYMCRSKSGILKMFPLGVYIVPLLVGTMAQALFYGISTIAVSLAIAMAGIVMCLQNELVFKDGLTGLYNRVYLDHHLKFLALTSNPEVRALMINITGLKSINLSLGYAMGDNALVHLAAILQNTLRNVGVAVRYSGDEFIVLLNAKNDAEVNSCIQAVEIGLDSFNSRGLTPYKLVVSIGFARQNLRKYGTDGFINAIHSELRKNKVQNL